MIDCRCVGFGMISYFQGSMALFLHFVTKQVGDQVIFGQPQQVNRGKLAHPGAPLLNFEKLSNVGSRLQLNQTVVPLLTRPGARLRSTKKFLTPMYTGEVVT